MLLILASSKHGFAQSVQVSHNLGQGRNHQLGAGEGYGPIQVSGRPGNELVYCYLVSEISLLHARCARVCDKAAANVPSPEKAG